MQDVGRDLSRCRAPGCLLFNLSGPASRRRGIFLLMATWCRRPEASPRGRSWEAAISNAVRVVTAQMQKQIDHGSCSRMIDADDRIDALLAIADHLEASAKCPVRFARIASQLDKNGEFEAVSYRWN